MALLPLEVLIFFCGLLLTVDEMDVDSDEEMFDVYDEEESDIFWFGSNVLFVIFK